MLVSADDEWLLVIIGCRSWNDEHAVDGWAWSICGCTARCDECELIGLSMIGFCQSVDVRHGACWNCVSMIGLCPSVVARHGTMRGTFGVHAATAASWLSECMWNPSNERLSFRDLLCVANGVCDLSLGLSVVGLQENQGLCMRTSARICPSCSSV